MSITFDAMSGRHRPAPIATWSPKFRVFKPLFDYTFAVLALPFTAVVALALLVLNPSVNPGPVFFRQDRMGLGGQKFRIWKFRTMIPSEDDIRPHDAELEQDRITKLGGFLRKSRIDELPNFFNVLTGDISIVGPRPDAWSHAVEHINVIPRYRERFRVKPGITGLAQVRQGYADTSNATARKARYDLFYVRKSKMKLDLFIIWETFVVLCAGFGVK